MTKIKIEILDDDAIDREYYGYTSICRIIQLSKPNGEIQIILDNLHQKFQSISSIIYAIEKKQTLINNLTTQIKNLNRKISSDKRKLTIARKAVKNVQPTFNSQTINNPEIGKNEKEVLTLKDQVEKEMTSLTKLQLTYETTYEENPLCETIKALIKKNIPITDQTIFNTVIGATMLYDELIDDGWTVDDPFEDSINQLNADMAYTNDETVIPTPKKPDIYRSKHKN